MSIKKTGTDGFWADGRKGQSTVDADVFATLGYPYASDLELTSAPKVYYFADNGDPDAIETNEEEQINLYANQGYFIVNTKGQGKIVLSSDAQYDTDFAENYPDAELDFINNNAPLSSAWEPCTCLPMREITFTVAKTASSTRSMPNTTNMREPLFWKQGPSTPM